MLPKVRIQNEMYNQDTVKYETVILEWEVLTIHIEKNTMRCRTVWMGEKYVYNFPADPFFGMYEIVSK